MASDNTVRVRVAPSPTGLLHVGVTRTAIFNWLLARHCGGRFILRIEDTDQTRCRPEYQQNILEALRWLGLDWDEGPEADGPHGPYVQSQRVQLYREHARSLLESGHAYYCYCSPERLADMRRRQEQEQRGEALGYDRLCRHLSAEERAQKEAEGIAPTIRFAVPLSGTTDFRDIIVGRMMVDGTTVEGVARHTSFENASLDDFVILKSDGFPTYHLASVVDDHLMAMTHVLRAQEWISSTPRHVLLYAAFGWEPPAFGHLPMVLGTDRAKLSKRHGATAVTAYRDQGYLPHAMFNFLALLGWAPGDDREVMTRDELIEAFSIDGIGKAPSIFDITKLDWMNGHYIRSCDRERFTELALPYLIEAGLVGADPGCAERDQIGRVLALAQERVKVLSELPRLTEFFFRAEPKYDPAAVKKWLTKDYVPSALTDLATRFEAAQPFDAANTERAVRGLADQLEMKPAALIHPTRVAVTGRTTGPGLFETLEVLGKERCLKRLRKAVALAAESQNIE
ncbi:MAG: glutamate--tRNA ligase [Armatimonadota bacterium]|nr:MAG: glutamate--tRNA ligase [Armatimonadota bacterium]